MLKATFSYVLSDKKLLVHTYNILVLRADRYVDPILYGLMKDLSRSRFCNLQAFL